MLTLTPVSSGICDGKVWDGRFRCNILKGRMVRCRISIRSYGQAARVVIARYSHLYCSEMLSQSLFERTTRFAQRQYDMLAEYAYHTHSHHALRAQSALPSVTADTCRQGHIRQRQMNHAGGRLIVMSASCMTKLFGSHPRESHGI
jgi:hypothetical protein